MGHRRVVAVLAACVVGSALLGAAGAPAIQLKQATMPGTADVAQSPANRGFWTVDVSGDVKGRDGAREYGSLRNHQLSRPIVGMSATRTGKGYWLTGTDGGVFAFGDAGYHGSTGGARLNQPIVGIAATPSGNGYWLARRTVACSRSGTRASSDRPVGCGSTSRSWASPRRRPAMVTGSSARTAGSSCSVTRSSADRPQASA